VAKKRNPTKISVEEFLESQTIQPSFDPARFRMGEEKIDLQLVTMTQKLQLLLEKLKKLY
jgi:hypothetical protein